MAIPKPKPLAKPTAVAASSSNLRRHLGQSSDTPEFAEVPVGQIRPNPHQARTVFRDDEIKVLANNIAEFGQMQPIVIRRAGDDEYELVAGERRLRAVQLLGKTEIYALISPKDADDGELSLIENLQRVDLDSVDLAKGLQALLNSNAEYTHERVGYIVGMSKDTVTRILGILKLPDHMLTEYHGVSDVVSLSTLVDLSRKVGEVNEATLDDLWERAKKGRLSRSEVRKPTEDAPSPVERNLRTLTKSVSALSTAGKNGSLTAADISRLKALRDLINEMID